MANGVTQGPGTVGLLNDAVSRTMLEEERKRAEQNAGLQAAYGSANAVRSNRAEGRDIIDPTQAQQTAEQQRAAAAALGGSAEQLGGIGQRYIDYSQAGPGPSVAQAQLQQAAAQNQAAQLGMARSVRGSTSANAALRGAAVNNANTAAQTNQTAAILRAQEDDAYKQRQLAALGGAQSAYGAQGGLYNAQGGLYGTERAQDVNQQQQYLDQQKMNDAAALGWEQASQGRYGAQQDIYAQQGGREDSRFAILSGASEEDRRLRQEASDRERAAKDARNANYIQTGATILGTAAMAGSDERLKTDIREDSAADALRDVGSWRYRYRDPKHGEGEYTGPMAQELERTPGGRSTVVDTPEGKMVHTGRLALLTASAVAEQQRDLDRLKAALDG